MPQLFQRSKEISVTSQLYTFFKINDDVSKVYVEV